MIVKSYPFMGKRVTSLADLPVPFPGAFLGREKLLDEVGRQLSAKVATMLYGAEGVGKTTLAAAALRAQRASHTVWINAGFSDLGALCDQVGQAYEDRDILDAPDPEAHRARTRSRLDEAQPLLVIDDVANPQAVRAFMRDIAADLPVLALADEQLSGPWAPLALGGLSRPAATALFYHHSRLEPGADADNVDRVCALLEDHPLSLEVVARLVAVDQVSPGELLAALPSAVVAGGSTARGALHLAFERLAPGGQTLVLVLGATFASGGTPEVLAAVADLTVDYVQQAARRLEGRGLCRVIDVGGLPFVMVHQAVHGFAHALLARMDRLAAAEERMARALAAYARRHAGDDVALNAEWGNLRGALGWAVRAGDAAQAGALGETLADSALLTIHGHARLREELASLGAAAVDAAPPPTPEVATAPALDRTEFDWPGGALVEAGDAHLRAGRLNAAEAAYAEAFDLAHEAEDAFLQGRLLQRLGSVSDAARHFDQSAERYRQAAIAAHHAGDLATEGGVMAQMGTAFTRLGRYDHAVGALQRAIPILQKAGQGAGLWRAFNELGLALSGQGRHTEAVEAHRRALQAARAEANREGERDVLLCLGDAHRRTNQPELAIGSYRQALDRSRALGDRQAEEQALGAMGIAYLRLDEPASAVEYLAQALSVGQSLGEDGRERAWIGTLARAYEALGDEEKAIAAYRRAVELAHADNDRQAEADYLNALGLLFARQRRYDEAIAHLEQARDIAQVIRAHAERAGYLNNAGLVYMETGQVETAIVNFQQALEISRSLGDRQGEGQALGNIGVAYSRLANWEVALRHHLPALEIARESDDLHDQGRLLGNIGLAYAALGQRDSALQAYKEALDIAYRIDDLEGRAALLFLLGSLLMDDLPYLAEAVSMLEESYAIRRERDDALVPETLRRLGRAKRRLERAQQAGLAILPASTAEERQAASRNGARRGAVRRAAANAASAAQHAPVPERSSRSEGALSEPPPDLPE